MDFGNFAKAPKGGNTSKGWQDEDAIGFLRSCRDNKIRVTYGGVSLLKLPEATDGLNRGRHGSGVVKSLPLDVQPIVCRTNGEYHEKAQQAFQAIEGFNAEDGLFTAEVDGKKLAGMAAIATWSVIPADKIQEAFQAFKAEQAQAETEE